MNDICISDSAKKYIINKIEYNISKKIKKHAIIIPKEGYNVTLEFLKTLSYKEISEITTITDMELKKYTPLINMDSINILIIFNYETDNWKES